MADGNDARAAVSQTNRITATARADLGGRPCPISTLGAAAFSAASDDRLVAEAWFEGILRRAVARLRPAGCRSRVQSRKSGHLFPPGIEHPCGEAPSLGAQTKSRLHRAHRQGVSPWLRKRPLQLLRPLSRPWSPSMPCQSGRTKRRLARARMMRFGVPVALFPPANCVDFSCRIGSNGGISLNEGASF